MTTVQESVDVAADSVELVEASRPRRRFHWLRPRRKPRPPVRAAKPLGPGWATVTFAVLALGLLAVWVLLYAFVLSGVLELRDQTVLYAQLRQELSEATAPLGGGIQAGSPVFLINAPSAAMRNVVVVEGTTSGDLTSGPGHRSDSVLPGQAGVSVLMGRSVTFGGPFARIDQMQPGDQITVVTGQGEFTYSVDRVRHPGDPLPAPLSAGQSRLVLVSSSGSGWRTGWAPQQTVYVDSSLVKGGIQPAPGGGPTGLTPAEQAMQGDTSDLVVLVLWLQLMIAVAVLTVWGRFRWGRLQIWLISVPLMAACLWGATRIAFELLPNLI